MTILAFVIGITALFDWFKIRAPFFQLIGSNTILNTFSLLTCFSWDILRKRVLRGVHLITNSECDWRTYTVIFRELL